MKDNLQNAYQYAKAGLYEKGLKICNDFILNHPNERDGYKQRSFILARMERWNDAIEDINTIINIGPIEPDDYFSRGRWNLISGNIDDAIKDFTEVIRIEKDISDHYYTESSFFYRAEANYQAGYYSDAIKDCENVRDGFSVYLMGKQRSKEGILRDAKIADAR